MFRIRANLLIMRMHCRRHKLIVCLHKSAALKNGKYPETTYCIVKYQYKVKGKFPLKGRSYKIEVFNFVYENRYGKIFVPVRSTASINFPCCRVPLMKLSQVSSRGIIMYENT